jgi:hypothetical protein
MDNESFRRFHLRLFVFNSFRIVSMLFCISHLIPPQYKCHFKPKIMKKLKQISLAIVFLILTVYCFKGFLYRKTIKYKEINQRSLIKIENKRIKDDLDFWLKTNQNTTVEQTVDFAHWYSTAQIEYTSGKCSTNPNHVIEDKLTNCIGYSASLHAVLSYLLAQKGYSQQVKSEHKVGQLYLFGFNIHKLFKDPAFQDHDYNVITDKLNNKKYMIDPTVSANLGIKSIIE